MACSLSSSRWPACWRPRCLRAQGGPTDRQKVDPAAAARGRTVYAAQCINCHGSTAKGGPNGPDLIRSTAVLRDRLGSHIGPAMRAAATSHQAALTAEQIVDVSHFLRDRVEAVTRNRTPTAPIDVLTGDPEAGQSLLPRRWGLQYVSLAHRRFRRTPLADARRAHAAAAVPVSHPDPKRRSESKSPLRRSRARRCPARWFVSTTSTSRCATQRATTARSRACRA